MKTAAKTTKSRNTFKGFGFTLATTIASGLFLFASAATQAQFQPNQAAKFESTISMGSDSNLTNESRRDFYKSQHSLADMINQAEFRTYGEAVEASYVSTDVFEGMEGIILESTERSEYFVITTFRENQLIDVVFDAQNGEMTKVALRGVIDASNIASLYEDIQQQGHSLAELIKAAENVTNNKVFSFGILESDRLAHAEYQFDMANSDGQHLTSRINVTEDGLFTSDTELAIR